MRTRDRTIQQLRTNILDYLRLQESLQKQNEALRAEVQRLSTENARLGAKLTSAANSRLAAEQAWRAHADSIHTRLCRTEHEVAVLHQTLQQARRDESAAVAQMVVAEAREAIGVGELASRDRRITALEDEVVQIFMCYEAMLELNKTLDWVCRVAIGRGNDLGNNGEEENEAN